MPRSPNGRTVEWLPKYAPELDDIERSLQSLEALHLSHQTFDSPDALESAIHRAVKDLNARSTAIALAKQRIHAWRRDSPRDPLPAPVNDGRRRAIDLAGPLPGSVAGAG